MGRRMPRVLPTPAAQVGAPSPPVSDQRPSRTCIRPGGAGRSTLVAAHPADESGKETPGPLRVRQLGGWSGVLVRRRRGQGPRTTITRPVTAVLSPPSSQTRLPDATAAA